MQAADWVITVGPQDPGPSPAGTAVQHWQVEGFLDEDAGPSLVAALDNRGQALWVEIISSPEFHR